MARKNKRIGVFDSGFGGIHILRGIVRKMPQYDYVYLGDTARTPYGSRSKEVVHEFTRQAVDFLFAHGCNLVVLACNTASSDALRKIQREYLPKKHPGKNVIGVLIPAAEGAVRATKNGRIGVIATEGTVRSNAFVKELTKLAPSVSAFQNAAPLLVPIVEAGEDKSEIARHMLRRYLAPLTRRRIDTLILGCTHYGILESEIRKIVGGKTKIVSEARIVPRKLEEYLNRHPEYRKDLGTSGKIDFYSTDATEAFERLGKRFFGKKISAKRAELR